MSTYLYNLEYLFKSFEMGIVRRDADLEKLFTNFLNTLDQEFTKMQTLLGAPSRLVDFSTRKVFDIGAGFLGPLTFLGKG